MNKNVKIYKRDEIQKVYHQHAYHCGSVLYSNDGYTWQSVPMDSGKWDIHKWSFAFIERPKTSTVTSLQRFQNYVYKNICGAYTPEKRLKSIETLYSKINGN